jgi:hypothetical protein
VVLWGGRGGRPHGEVGDATFAEEQLAAFLEIARLGREVHADRMSLDDAIAASPFGRESSRGPLERTLAQLRGELDQELGSHR